MMQSSFPEDTLFLVFEEDWRLTDTELHEPNACSQFQESGKRGVQVLAGKAIGEVYQEPRKDQWGRMPEHNAGTVVDDLVSYVTAAHRHGKGDIVWLTWQPGQGDKVKRSQSICSGSMLLGISKVGAMRLQEAFAAKELRLGHFDISLLRWLMDGDRGKSFSCYIVPPIGNYKSHLSGCEEHYKDEPRPSCWTSKWVCPGTRKGQDPKQRDKYLAWHTTKGEPEWITLVNLDKDFEELAWRTFWAVPDKLRPDHELLRRVAGASDPNALASATGAAGASEPNALASAGSASSSTAPLGNPAEVIDVAMQDDQDEPKLKETSRAARRRRREMSATRFRMWTSDRSKAHLLAVFVVS